MTHKFKRTFGGTRSVSARAWMDQFSSPPRLEEPAAPTKLERAKTLAIEQWDGEKWVTRILEWNGEQYVEVTK